VLACSLMTESHTGEYIAKMLDDIHHKFRIEETVVRTTTDNGSNFVASFKTFGPPAMRSQSLPDAVDDDLGEEMESMSQQAAPRQSLFKLNVDDVITAVDDEPTFIELHDDLLELAAEEEVTSRYSLPKHARCAAHTLNLIASADINKAKSTFNSNLLQALEKSVAVWNMHSTSYHLRLAVKEVRKFFNLSKSK
jgi:hypothetical protein